MGGICKGIRLMKLGMVPQGVGGWRLQGHSTDEVSSLAGTLLQYSNDLATAWWWVIKINLVNVTEGWFSTFGKLPSSPLLLVEKRCSDNYGCHASVAVLCIVHVQGMTVKLRPCLRFRVCECTVSGGKPPAGKGVDSLLSWHGSHFLSSLNIL